MLNTVIYRQAILGLFFCFFAFCMVTGVFAASSFGGEAADLAFIRKVNPIQQEKTQEVIRLNLQETSELKLTATALIRLYQKFISSQDSPTCNFVPTCSHFGMACVQEYGVLRGICLTADRLLRCNGSQSPYYHKDLKTGKNIDPISDYAK